MTTDPPAPFDCLATAAVLRAGGTISLAAHVAALLSIFPITKGGSGAIIAAASLVVWCVAVYLAIRVRIDVHFFELLASQSGTDGQPAATQLDAWLLAADLKKAAPPRSLAARRSGALRLWRILLVAVAIQIAMVLTALFTLLT